MLGLLFFVNSTLKFLLSLIHKTSCIIQMSVILFLVMKNGLKLRYALKLNDSADKNFKTMEYSESK